VSTFWILTVEFFAMVMAASSLDFVRRHPQLFQDGAETPTDRLAMLTWTQPDGPPAWYLVTPPCAAGEDAELEMGSAGAAAPEPADVSRTTSLRTPLPRPRAPR
jgi:hypothetical protein